MAALDRIVAEITNTLEGASRLRAAGRNGHAGRTSLRWRFDKCFHVSPFMPMDCHYDWRFNCPDEDLRVHAGLARRRAQFDATQVMQRHPWMAAGWPASWLLSTDDHPGGGRHPLACVAAVAETHTTTLPLPRNRDEFDDSFGRAAAPGALDAFLRRRLLAQLAPMRDGRLCVRDALGEVWLGDARGELHVTVTIEDPAFYRKVAAQGSVGAGESYIHGEWRCDDLVALIRLLVRNRDLLDSMEHGPARVGGWLLRGWNRLRRNSREGSRRNIAAHYDLGNDFFALFLSPDLMYSSALFAERASRWNPPRGASWTASANSCSSSRATAWWRSVPAGVVLRCTRRSTTAATSPQPRSPPSSMHWPESASASPGCRTRSRC